MTWEPRPLPKTNPETKRYWNEATKGNLVIKQCQDCDFIYYYPRQHCPECFGNNTTWIESSGTGEIYSFTFFNQMEGWPDRALPLILAYVELKEGPRMLTNIVDCDPSDVTIGDPVHVKFIPTNDTDIAIPVFALSMT